MMNRKFLTRVIELPYVTIHLSNSSYSYRMMNLKFLTRVIELPYVTIHLSNSSYSYRMMNRKFLTRVMNIGQWAEITQTRSYPRMVGPKSVTRGAFERVASRLRGGRLRVAAGAESRVGGAVGAR